MTKSSPYGEASIATLEIQSAKLLAEFESFGARRIEPAIVQPAGAFLDRMGEDLRKRTYVFTGPDGSEFCLRPDLTIPAAQYYLADAPACDRSMKLCYAGPVFRHDPASPETPGQSLQAGVECFNSATTAAADVEVLLLTHKALESAGLKSATITFGDAGLLRALLEAQGLPAHWIAKIRRHAWHRERLHALLQRLTSGVAVDNQFVASLKDHPPERARQVLRDALDLGGIKIIGTRSFDEIADRFIERASEAASARLTQQAAQLIEKFLSLRSTADKAVAFLNELSREASITLANPLTDLSERLALLEKAGLDLTKLEFASQFGRNMEYYTGFVFEFRAAAATDPMAGGGRYDDLLTSLGAPRRTPSIGLAVFCDRLATAIARQSGAP